MKRNKSHCRREKNINNSKRNGFLCSFLYHYTIHVFLLGSECGEKERKEKAHYLSVCGNKGQRATSKMTEQNSSSSYIVSYSKVSKFLLLSFQTHQVFNSCVLKNSLKNSFLTFQNKLVLACN